MSKQDGGPVFPHLVPDWSDRDSSRQWDRLEDGMSLRDWFAGMALQRMMAAQIELSKLTNENELTHMKTPRATAEAVYEIADAMLAARVAE